MKNLLLLPLILLTACCYQFGRGELSERYSTICIPYVEGDDQGFLTTALIRQLSASGGLLYRSSGSDLLLRVCLLQPIDKNIGFIYAPKGDNDPPHTLVSNEARLTQTALIRLIDRRTGECILGPCEITVSLAYDFEPDLSHIADHQFSLGQLEMHDLAQDAATPGLYRLLAEKIIDYVNHAW